jgi:hypothetical protein
MNFRKIFRWCFVALVCIILALAGYVIWRLIKAHWAPILFFAFVIIGIVEAVNAAVVAGRLRSQPSRDFLWIALTESGARTPLVRFQLKAQELIQLLEVMTGSWVCPFIRSMLSRRPESLIQYGAQLAVEGVTASAEAPTGLVLILVAYGIAYVAPAEMH